MYVPVSAKPSAQGYPRNLVNISGEASALCIPNYGLASGLYRYHVTLNRSLKGSTTRRHRHPRRVRWLKEGRAALPRSRASVMAK
jgi:hypothetical protein